MNFSKFASLFSEMRLIKELHEEKLQWTVRHSRSTMLSCASYLKKFVTITQTFSLYIMHKEVLIHPEGFEINRDTRARDPIQEIRLLITLFRENHPKFSF